MSGGGKDPGPRRGQGGTGTPRHSPMERYPRSMPARAAPLRHLPRAPPGQYCPDIGPERAARPAPRPMGARRGQPAPGVPGTAGSLARCRPPAPVTGLGRAARPGLTLRAEGQRQGVMGEGTQRREPAGSAPGPSSAGTPRDRPGRRSRRSLQSRDLEGRRRPAAAQAPVPAPAPVPGRGCARTSAQRAPPRCPHPGGAAPPGT